MTQAACALILHLSTLRLAWRSMKSLKLPPHMIDTEILISWSLIAFHGVLLPLERIISYLPLYYYGKMLLLIGTFLPNTRIPRVWFDVVLVPGIERLHRLLDIGICGWLIYQARLAPWRLVDLILLPGILSEGDNQKLRQQRSAELKEARLKSPLFSVSFVNDEMSRTLDEINCREKPALPCTDAGRTVEDDTESMTKMGDHITKTGRFAGSTQGVGLISSPNLRSRMVASSLHLRKFSREHTAASEILLPIRSTPRDTCSMRSPPAPIFPRTSPRLIGSTGESKSDLLPFEEEKAKTPQRICFDSYSPAVGKTDDKKCGRARRSLRAFVTGDSNIRVRDFMFDLDMPALPTPRFAAGSRDCGISLISPRGCSTDMDCCYWSARRENEDVRKARKERSRRRRTTGTVLHRHNTEDMASFGSGSRRHGDGSTTISS